LISERIICDFVVCSEKENTLFEVPCSFEVELLGMHKTTYTNYEQGKREIPFEVVIRLAKYYNVSIDYIAELISEPRKIYNKKD